MAYSDILRTGTWTGTDAANLIDGLIPAMQNNTYTYGGVSTGSANVHAISTSQAPSAYANGQLFYFRAGYTNSAATTLNVNSLGAIAVQSGETMAALIGGEIIVNRLYQVIYYSSVFYLLNPSDNEGVNFYGGTSTGSANAQAITLPNALLAYKDGQLVTFRAGYTNTGSATLAVNGLSAITIYDNDTRAALVGGEITASSLYKCIYYSSNFYLLNPTSSAWTTYATTHVGFSVNPTYTMYYKKTGRTVDLSYNVTGLGTSNATNYTITIPFTAATRAGHEWSAQLNYANNNGVATTGFVVVASAGTTAILYNTNALNWTASGTKGSKFGLTYEAAS